MIQRIFPEGLLQALEKGLSSFYLLSGQDLLLINESTDAIVHFARQQQFDEKNEFSINNETKWDTLFELVQSNGLFSTRQIIVLHFPDSLTATQQKQLGELFRYSHKDLLFILHYPKLNKLSEKQVWFTSLQSQAVIVNCQTPDITKLPSWVSYRAKNMQLKLDQDTIQFLCYSYEGNLLALKQILQRFQLQFNDSPIGLNQAQEIVEQSVQFTPFQWVDALLAGKIQRALRILTYLRQEETQPVVLLRIVQKELTLVLEMTRSNNAVTLNDQYLLSGNLRTEFDRLKVWQNRRGLYQQFIQRTTYHKFYKIIQRLAELERQIKRDFSEEIWQSLEDFSILYK